MFYRTLDHGANCTSDVYVVDEMTGVTCLDDVMYVVCKNSCSILLYNTENYSQLDQVIAVDGLRNPSDIVACLDSIQLYIADMGDGSPCIWQVSVEGNLPMKWSLNISHVETLSVTSGHLLVTSVDSLHLYSTATGQHLRDVALSKKMQLCHGVETTRQTFIVSYRTSQWEYGVSNRLAGMWVSRLSSDRLKRRCTVLGDGKSWWRRKLPSGVRGRVPAAQRFSSVFSPVDGFFCYMSGSF